MFHYTVLANLVLLGLLATPCMEHVIIPLLSLVAGSLKLLHQSAERGEANLEREMEYTSSQGRTSTVSIKGWTISRMVLSLAFQLRPASHVSSLHTVMAWSPRRGLVRSNRWL